MLNYKLLGKLLLIWVKKLKKVQLMIVLCRFGTRIRLPWRNKIVI